MTFPDKPLLKNESVFAIGVMINCWIRLTTFCTADPVLNIGLIIKFCTNPLENAPSLFIIFNMFKFCDIDDKTNLVLPTIAFNTTFPDNPLLNKESVLAIGVMMNCWIILTRFFAIELVVNCAFIINCCIVFLKNAPTLLTIFSTFKFWAILIGISLILSNNPLIVIVCAKLRIPKYTLPEIALKIAFPIGALNNPPTRPIILLPIKFSKSLLE